MSYAIETRDLSYAFAKDRKVVDAVSLQVPTGSIFGFLGPNGAGKTTTIRLLAGMLLSSRDNIFLNGKSLQTGRPGIFKDTGWLIETPSLYGHLTGRENLRLLATLRGLPAARVDAVLETVRLTEAANRKAKEYSLGMKQRLGIAMALLPDPSLLVLDEPVNGLDPTGIVEIRELLIRLHREEGKTVCISSHLLHEIEKTCTHIGIIHNGKLLFQGTLNALRQGALASGEVVFRIPDIKPHLHRIAAQYPQAKRYGQQEVIFPYGDEAEVTSINQWLVSQAMPVAGIQVRGGLEEWFMQAVKAE